MYGAKGDDGILGLADEIQTPEALDAALDAAKAEGNLSRANVARKAKEKAGQSRRMPRPAAEKTLNGIHPLEYDERPHRAISGGAACFGPTPPGPTVPRGRGHLLRLRPAEALPWRACSG